MHRGGLSNSGEMTTVHLENAIYAADQDITGTVELSNMQRKEITNVTLELSTWRHIATSRSKKSSVEQLSKQTLELFPNTGEHKRYGHDDKVLQANVMFTFTFSGDAKRYPTIDFLENARIKNYITCYVYRKSGLLSRERLVEKNQFQVALGFPSIGVDGMFPDRFFNCLVSRPLSANDPSYDFRARCNTHLLPGLPFLIEIDMAVQADIESIVLSLHQAVSTAIGTDQDDHSMISRYVHEVRNPVHSEEGHFRDRDSARRLSHGRRSWLVEWLCPNAHSRTKLPMETTFYCRTNQGNMERGLTLKVEVELRNSSKKLQAMLHGLHFSTEWTDSRADRGISLRRARALVDTNSPASSIRTDSRQDRRGSVYSTRSTLNDSTLFAEHLYNNIQATTPLTSPQYSVKSADYFASISGAQRQRIQPGTFEPKLTHGSYSPQAVQLSGRSDSVRSTASSLASRRQTGGPSSVAVRNVSGKARPEKLVLPPASVRSSMSSAFESLNLRHSASNSLSSPTRRDFGPASPGLYHSRHSDMGELSPGLHNVPTPPPTQPLPPRPPSSGQHVTSSLVYNNPSTSSLAHGFPTPAEEPRVLPKKATKLSRPAVILGVSQDTVQIRENAAEQQSAQKDFDTAYQLNAYTASIQRVSKTEEKHQSSSTTDWDSGFSDTSYVPAAPVMANNTLSLTRPKTSSGFARRATQKTLHDTRPSAAEESGEIMLR